MSGVLTYVQRAMAARLAELEWSDGASESVFRLVIAAGGPFNDAELQRFMAGTPSAAVACMGYDVYPEGGVPMAKAQMLITVAANDVSRPGLADGLKSRHTLSTDMSEMVTNLLYTNSCWGIEGSVVAITAPDSIQWRNTYDGKVDVQGVALWECSFLQDIEIFNVAYADLEDLDSIYWNLVPDLTTGEATPNIEGEVSG